MCSKFIPYTPHTIVGTAMIAAHEVILRMSSFCATDACARLACRMELSSSSKERTCSCTRARWSATSRKYFWMSGSINRIGRSLSSCIGRISGETARLNSSTSRLSW